MAVGVAVVEVVVEVDAIALVVVAAAAVLEGSQERNETGSAFHKDSFAGVSVDVEPDKPGIELLEECCYSKGWKPAATRLWKMLGTIGVAV